MHFRMLLSKERDIKELLDHSLPAKTHIGEKIVLPGDRKYLGLLFTYATKHPQVGFGKLTSFVDKLRFTDPENLLMMEDEGWLCLFKPDYVDTNSITGELFFKIKFD